MMDPMSFVDEWEPPVASPSPSRRNSRDELPSPPNGGAATTSPVSPGAVLVHSPTKLGSTAVPYSISTAGRGGGGATEQDAVREVEAVNVIVKGPVSPSIGAAPLTAPPPGLAGLGAPATSPGSVLQPARLAAGDS